MSLRLRSSSVGSRPRPRLHRPSRSESAAALALDVRCACQYYETSSLLPERVNPMGYNAAQEYEPCIHVHARLKEHEQQQDEEEQQSGSHIGLLPTVQAVAIAPNQHQPNVSARIVTAHPHSKVYELPPEFAPENLYIDTNMVNRNIAADENAFGNRSFSCANMDATTPQYMKQRDPSTSSLLRKRMSEERMSQGFSVLNKRASGSISSRDRFSTQKDPSESTILRRKMSNRSSGSFEHANSEMMSNERIQQPYQFQSSRIPNERTFYHDSNEYLRNSNVNVGDLTEPPLSSVPSPSSEQPLPPPPPPQKLEIASPLSMQAQGNRRFVLSSTENLPHQQIDAYMKTSVETEPDSGIDSNYVDEPQPRNRNVSDEEKVQILLSKSNTQNASERIAHASTENASIRAKPTEAKQHQKLQLMNVEDVKMEIPVRTKIQYQYLAKADNTIRPQEAETSDYSYSKLFDNYKSSDQSLAQISNISTPDLHLNYAKQRDPSCSPFIQNRYKMAAHETASVPPISMEMKTTNHDRLLPSAGELPERRASDVFRPPPNQDGRPSSFIRQKDLRTSNVLNRRRRNLSQSSLGQDFEMVNSNGQPTKVTKTISFEKNLSQIDCDQISPYTGTSIKIVKGVSFDRPIPSDPSEQNAFDALQLSANKRPFR